MVADKLEQEARVFIENTVELLPLIASCAEANHHTRDIAPEVVASLKAAGLLRLLQPAKWGGYEQDPRVLYAVQRLIAEKCPSTGWIVGVLSVQSFLVAIMSEQCQQDVWGEDPSAILSSSFVPKGSTERCEGGYQLTGEWPYSSGCAHAQWAIVGGVVPDRENQSQPGMQLFVVPRNDYEIVDTWHTYGLRGTGSNTLKLDGVFVPEHRAFQTPSGLTPLVDASDLPRLYRLPWLYLFTSSVANVGIGIARAARSAFIDTCAGKRSFSTGKLLTEDPAIQELLGRLTAEIDAAATLFDRHLDTLFSHIASCAELSMENTLVIRTQLTSVLKKLAMIVDEMQLMTGASGVLYDSPLTRIWLDMCAARAHPGNDPSLPGANLGKFLLDP